MKNAYLMDMCNFGRNEYVRSYGKHNRRLYRSEHTRVAVSSECDYILPIVYSLGAILSPYKDRI